MTAKKSKTNKTGKARSTKTESKLESLSFADGKKEENLKKAQELEELVGLNMVNPYGTSITAVFEKNMEELSLADMQELAVKVGVFPSGTKTSLRNKLKKSFRDYQRGSSSFAVPSPSPLCSDINREDPNFKKALQLMQKGL